MTLHLDVSIDHSREVLKGAARRTSASPHFEDAFWDDKWWLVLRDASRVQHIIDSIELPPVPGEAETREEIVELLKKQASPEREDRRAEIIIENDALPPYFNSILLLDAPGNEQTGKLITTAVVWARVYIMGKKYRYKRPRPSQLEPLITPMLPLPRHPAYPSGHSTQLHLVALVVHEITKQPAIGKAFWHHADEVALNREFAGFHYRSDSVAGERLAEGLARHFFEQEQFKDLIDAAKREWR